MNREQTLALLTQHKPVLGQRFGVCRLALFGSLARGTASEDSDVDILVAFDAAATSKRYLDLLHRPVDLVTESALRERLRPDVERDAIHV